MVSSNRNNHSFALLFLSFVLSLSLSLSLRRTSFTTPRRGVVPLWSKPFVFGLDCVSFIPLETTTMDEMTSVAREEDNTTTRDDAARRYDDEEHLGGGFLVLLGSSSASSRGLSLSCFFARVRRERYPKR